MWITASSLYHKTENTNPPVLTDTPKQQETRSNQSLEATAVPKDFQEQ